MFVELVIEKNKTDLTIITVPFDIIISLIKASAYLLTNKAKTAKETSHYSL